MLCVSLTVNGDETHYQPFFTAYMKDASSMWRSVALAPLARNACLRTLIFKKECEESIGVRKLVLCMYMYILYIQYIPK